MRHSILYLPAVGDLRGFSIDCAFAVSQIVFVLSFVFETVFKFKDSFSFFFSLQEVAVVGSFL